MTQSQLFAVAVRILGVFLLVQAVMQIPEGLVNGVVLCYFGFGRSASQYVPPTVYPAIVTAIVGFFLFAASGWYLLIGAPGLLRLAGVKPEPNMG